MNDREKPEWLKTETVLLEFDECEKEARRQLNAFVHKEVPQTISKILDRVKWPALLGTKEFIGDIKRMFKDKRIEKREIPQYKEITEPASTNDLIKAVNEEYSDKTVLENKMSKVNATKRRAIAYICRQYLNIPWREACTLLGGISYAALSKQFLLANKEIPLKQGCYKEFDKIVRRLKL